MNSATTTPAGSARDFTDGEMIKRYGGLLSLDPFFSQPLHPPKRLAELIPRDEIPALVKEIEARMAPATKRELMAVIALIGAAWPYAYQKTDSPALDLFVKQLMEDLAKFPADVLDEAVRQLRRTCRFSPAISEVYRTASHLMANRRRQLALARDHLAEHKRRDLEASADARAEIVNAAQRKHREAAEHARREAKAVERQRRREAERLRLAGIYGPEADLRMEDIEAAPYGLTLINFSMGAKWLQALDDGERWALRVLPIAGLAGRALPGYRNKTGLSHAQFCEMIRRASENVMAARQFLADAEAAKASGTAGPDLRYFRDHDGTVTLPQPGQMLAEIVSGIVATERDRTTINPSNADNA